MPDFSKLKSLKHLELKRLNLYTIPQSLAHLNNLQNIQLERNRLKNVPKQLLTLRFLKTINIAHNPISEIPLWLNQFHNLHDLGIDYEQRETLLEYDGSADNSWEIVQVSTRTLVSPNKGDPYVDPDFFHYTCVR